MLQYPLNSQKTLSGQKTSHLKPLTAQFRCFLVPFPAHVWFSGNQKFSLEPSQQPKKS
jgi:hypothetical protein